MNLSACEAGYERSEESDDCVDVNECVSYINNCRDDEICFNTPGSWSCCQPGYQLGADNDTCSDINECEDSSVCLHGQSCFNTMGSFVCCPTGSTPIEDSTQCLDCASEYNFFTNANKTRCAECPDGKGATVDHLGCHRIDGQWQSWGPWAPCSKSCVGEDGVYGEKSRQRSCTPPRYGGEDCDSAGFEQIQTCAGQGSRVTHCPVDGYWTNWIFGKCNRSCGGGRQLRTRICVPPRHGGRPCQGEPREEIYCNVQKCPPGVYVFFLMKDCILSQEPIELY